MHSDEACTNAWNLCLAESDALWHTIKYETLAARCEWLEKTLSHTQIMHTKVLSALSAERRSKEKEALMMGSNKRIDLLESEKQSLVEELHQVAWYKDAYDARTKQNDMLKSLLHLQMQSMERVKEVHKHIKDHDASNACESLTTRIDLLYQEKKKNGSAARVIGIASTRIGNVHVNATYKSCTWYRKL